MKKLFTCFLSLTLLLSLGMLFTNPVSAIDGDWMVYSSKGQYDEDFEGDRSPVVGYEYTDEGFHVVPADWKDFNPGFGLQTKNEVYIKDGVYLLIRVDEFTYANDKWFNLNLWSEEMVSPGSRDIEKNGYGVQNLIRPSNEGKVNNIEWHYNGFDSGGSVPMTIPEEERYDESGRVLLAMTVTWDEVGSTYAIDVNGSQAPASVIEFANEAFADGYAYVGFNCQNGNRGGTAGVTVLAFGTDKESAEVPVGDDSQLPNNNYIEFADPGNPDDIPYGKPGVFMNGSPVLSDSKSTHGKSSTGTTSLTDDYAVRIVAQSARVYESFGVKNEVSYLIEDFPVAIALTRNYCTCGDDICFALEYGKMYFMFGNQSSASESFAISGLNSCYDPIIKGEDTYLYFYADLREDAGFDFAGRINGLRFDADELDYTNEDANTFDICFVAFFRSLEEAELYIYDWIGVDPNAEDTESEESESVEQNTAESAQTETVETEDSAFETELLSESESTALESEPDSDVTPDPETTKKPEAQETEPAKSDAPAEDKGGCGSVVGFGVIAVVATVAACGIVSFKKKED